MAPTLRRVALPVAVLTYTGVSVAVFGALFVAFYGGDCFQEAQCVAHKRAFEEALPLLVFVALLINNLVVVALFRGRQPRAECRPSARGSLE